MKIFFLLLGSGLTFSEKSEVKLMFFVQDPRAKDLGAHSLSQVNDFLILINHLIDHWVILPYCVFLTFFINIKG